MNRINSNIQVVAFDCDGVMFDTTNANMAYYNQILNFFGKPAMTSEQFTYVHMHTADQALQYLFPDPKECEQANRYRKTMSYTPFIQAMVMEPDLKTVLRTIRPNYKTAVATNRSDTMAWVLSEFDLANDFDLVISANDVNHPKPSPEPLLKIINFFHIQPNQLLYVGDSKVDEAAATSAGAIFVAFRNPSLSAAYHINSLSEIFNILNIPSSIEFCAQNPN